ncbi:hypothetical protein ALC60_11670 [Trachymyrmex zeteki]|uniref:Nuclease HARBI1 n=1 Tax=Mycetomoellerius zeteki TaxID=64791 RepID=A0A151WN72_9HYME|nr:hypothetical protein ALC60_11670 [Trachymyrmex zeteki]
MDTNEDILTKGIAILIIGMYILKRRKSFRWFNRKYWMRPINMRRLDQGDFYHLLQEMKNDSEMFFRYTRMSLCVFNQLLEMIRPFLTKRSHRALTPEHRLALTLQYVYFNGNYASQVRKVILHT